MSCRIHGPTCSGEHASDVPPVLRDGVVLNSTAHTLTRVRLADHEGDKHIVLEFAGIAVVVALRVGMDAYEVYHCLEQLQNQLRHNFGTREP